MIGFKSMQGIAKNNANAGSALTRQSPSTFAAARHGIMGWKQVSYDLVFGKLPYEPWRQTTMINHGEVRMSVVFDLL